MNIDQLDYERIVKASLEKRGYLSIDKIRKELSIICKEERAKKGNFDFSVDDVIRVLIGIGYKIILHPIVYELMSEISEKYNDNAKYYNNIYDEIVLKLEELKIEFCISPKIHSEFNPRNIDISVKNERSVDITRYHLLLDHHKS